MMLKMQNLKILIKTKTKIGGKKKMAKNKFPQLEIVEISRLYAHVVTIPLVFNRNLFDFVNPDVFEIILSSNPNRSCLSLTIALTEYGQYTVSFRYLTNCLPTDIKSYIPLNTFYSLNYPNCEVMIKISDQSSDVDSPYAVWFFLLKDSPIQTE